MSKILVINYEKDNFSNPCKHFDLSERVLVLDNLMLIDLAKRKNKRKKETDYVVFMYWSKEDYQEFNFDFYDDAFNFYNRVLNILKGDSND